MSLIADGLLIVTCMTTAIYCFVLSRRLQRLLNTDQGIGRQILQFNSALDETRAAVSQMKAEAQRASAHLAREINEARKVTVRLEARTTAAKKSEFRSYSMRSSTEDMKTEIADSASTQIATAGTDSPDPDIGEADDVTGLAIEEPNPDEEGGEIDLHEIRDDRQGGQKLGFLPDIDMAEDDVDREPVVQKDRFKEGADDEVSRGLLKIERMAL